MILGFIFFLWESGDQRHSHVLIDLKPLILSFFCVCVCVLKYFTHILTDLVIFLFIYLNIYLFINLFVNSATLQPKKHSEYEIL